jgi:predicted transglutaminase-like cysteine proteinase
MRNKQALPVNLNRPCQYFCSLGLAAFVVCVSFPNAWAGARTEKLHIRQDSFRQQGVLVARPNPLDTSIAQLISSNNIRTLDDYARWLKQNVQYKSDGSHDDWLSPEQLLALKRGDCEDYTFLNAAVLRVLGFESRPLALKRGGGRNQGTQAHAICVFRSGENFFWFDNTRLLRTEIKNARDFNQHITEIYNSNQLLELNPDTRGWTLVFQKS